MSRLFVAILAVLGLGALIAAPAAGALTTAAGVTLPTSYYAYYSDSNHFGGVGVAFAGVHHDAVANPIWRCSFWSLPGAVRGEPLPVTVECTVGLEAVGESQLTGEGTVKYFGLFSLKADLSDGTHLACDAYSSPSDDGPEWAIDAGVCTLT